MMSGLQPVVRAGINGTEVSFVVDSGAVYSMIAPAAAERLQLPYRRAPDGLRIYGVGGRADIHVTRIERFTLRKTTFNNVEFIVGGNLPGRDTVGLLGQNFLGATDVEYDLANGVMRLHYPSDECKKASLAYWAKGQPVVEIELESTRGAYVPHIASTAYVNGVKIRVIFDTGAAVSTLSLQAARRAGITPDSEGVVSAGLARGVGRHEVATWIAPVKSFALGDEKINNTRLRFTDSDLNDNVDMLLGADFFLSHRLYVSRSQEKIYFTYNGGPVFNLLALAEDKTAEPSTDPGDATTTGDPSAPTAAEGFARRAAAFAARRDFNRALADMNHACEMEPGNARYLLQRARVLLALSKGSLALADLNDAARLDPTDVDVRLVRARVHLAMNNATGAREGLAAADSAASPRAHVRRDIANLYLALGLPEAALPQLDQWISAHAQEVDLHEALNSRCWARALLGTELEKALADCNAAIQTQPTSAYLDSRGLVYLRMKRLDASIEDYDAALRLDPKGAWSLYGRGLARLRSGAVEAGNADLAAAKAIRSSIEEEAKRYGLAP